MGLYVDTVSGNVVIPELGITIVHPATNFALSEQFDPEDLRQALSLTSAITGGTLLWKKTSGGTILTAGDYDPDIVDIDNENLGPGFSGDRTVTFKDLDAAVAVSASPGFTWGNSGNTPANTWLLNDTVPSNKTGRTFPLFNGTLTKLFVSNENVGTFDAELYEHDGTTFTLLATISLTAQRSKSQAYTSVSVTTDKELAIKIVNGSAKNPVVGAILKGTLT